VALLMSRCSLLNHGLHLPNLALIPDAETHERDALDAWLLGLTRGQYERNATLPRFGFTEPDDPRWPLEKVRDGRVEAFQSLERGDTTLLDRYPVHGLLLPTAAGRPRRGGPWTRRAGDPMWTLWGRPATSMGPDVRLP
jgi:hypothetical protein